MKKLLFFVLTTILMLTSCVFDATLEEVPSDANRVSVVTRGIVSLVNVGDENISVAVDSVKLADSSASVELTDSIGILPQEVDFRFFTAKFKVLDEKIISREKFFAVKELRCLLTLKQDKVEIPLEFSRQIVIGIDAQGKEYTPYYNFRLGGNQFSYIGSEGTGYYVRAYYDLVLDIYDEEEKIGTLKPRVSFFARSSTCVPLTFNVTVEDWQEINLDV